MNRIFLFYVLSLLGPNVRCYSLETEDETMPPSHVAPMIFLPSLLVVAIIGSDVTLACNVKSHPKPVTYWTRDGSGVMILSNTKYNSVIFDRGVHTVQMMLSIKSLGPEDFGSYTCVAKNSLGESEGTIRLKEIPDPYTSATKEVLKSSTAEDNRHLPPESEDCDPSAIPVMTDFDMKRFSGVWFELAKSASGYIDVNDGMWRIESNTFLFSGRDNNAHCIRPIKGTIHPADQPPGTMNLHYQTYSAHVEENIRVLFTDYSSIAVLYMCVHHVHREREVCHSAGVMGSIWTREPHVVLEVYERAARYLEMACVHKSILIPRNVIGPCKVDDAIFGMDDFPVPDFCYQPRDLGFCRGNLQRYYYDPKSRDCQNFTYHGCGGNRNNFMSLPECHEKCMSISPKDPVCLSTATCAIHCPPCCSEDRIGCVECNCEHVIEDDFLNCMKSPAYCQPECAVEEFYHGCYVCSCHEDVNEPFMEAPNCLQVKNVGNCRSHIERYYYNALSKECEKFNYTGCDGNKNNFQTMEECNEKCLGIILMKADEIGGDDATSIRCNIWVTGSLLLLFMIISEKIS